MHFSSLNNTFIVAKDIISKRPEKTSSYIPQNKMWRIYEDIFIKFSKALYERKLHAVYLEGEGADPPPPSNSIFYFF